MEPARKNRFLILFCFFAIYVIWGTTYLAIEVGLEDFPPFIMAAMRFTIAGTALLLSRVIIRERFPNIRNILINMLLGTVILSGGQGLIFWAQQYITSGYAAIFEASLPIWFIILDKKQWRVYFKNVAILSGIVLGFLGIYLLFESQLDKAGETSMQLAGSIAVIVSCICWVGGSLIYKNTRQGKSMYSDLGWQLVGGALCSLIVSLLRSETSTFSFQNVSLNGWLALFYLAVAGSLIAFLSYNYLITIKPPAVVGTYAYVNPVIAVFLGWLLASEKISATQVVGMVIVLLAALIINTSKNTKTSEELN